MILFDINYYSTTMASSVYSIEIVVNRVELRQSHYLFSTQQSRRCQGADY